MKQILCFGDSNTYGLIPGTTNQRYGWGTRWTSILDDKVRTKGYRVIEEGLCGRTTVFDDPFRTERRGTEMLPAILESHRPVDTIVLMLGTNDCKSVYSATPEVIRGLAGYVEAAVDGDVICAIGDEARIEDAKDAFTEVKSVF